MSTLQKCSVLARTALTFPFHSAMYLLAPESKTGQTMRKPFVKFLVHAASYVFFLCKSLTMVSWLITDLSERIELLSWISYLDAGVATRGSGNSEDVRRQGGKEEHRNGIGEAKRRGAFVPRVCRCPLRSWIHLARDERGTKLVRLNWSYLAKSNVLFFSRKISQWVKNRISCLINIHKRLHTLSKWKLISIKLVRSNLFYLMLLFEKISILWSSVSEFTDFQVNTSLH